MIDDTSIAPGQTNRAHFWDPRMYYRSPTIEEVDLLRFFLKTVRKGVNGHSTRFINNMASIKEISERQMIGRQKQKKLKKIFNGAGASLLRMSFPAEARRKDKEK